MLSGIREPSDRKPLLQALKRAFFHTTFDAVRVGILLADAPRGAVAPANHEAQRIFRGTIRQGQRLDSYAHWGALGEDGNPLKGDEYPLARVVLRGNSTSAQLVLCPRDDGRRMRVALTEAPAHGHNGQIVAGVMAAEELGAPKAAAR